MPSNERDIGLTPPKLSKIPQQTDKVKLETMPLSSLSLSSTMNIPLAFSSPNLRIRVVEDPLTAQNLASIFAILTELHTKCWLIEQGRFDCLIEYTQTRDARYAEEANLVVANLTKKSTHRGDLLLASPTVALALKIGIDAILQTPQRLEAAKLANKLKELELKIKDEDAEIKLQQEKQRVEFEKQVLALRIERFELEVQSRNYAKQTANMMVDALRPEADPATKTMLATPLVSNLLQLNSVKDLELVQEEPQNKEEPKQEETKHDQEPEEK